MLASFPAQAFTQRWLKLGSSVAAKPCILANEKSEPRSVQPLSEADTPAYLTIKPVGADRILAQGRALLLAGAHDQKIVGNRWSVEKEAFPRVPQRAGQAAVMAPPHRPAQVPAATGTTAPNLRRPAPAPASHPTRAGHAPPARPGWSGP